jgi:tetratricopeptide (TPR) repeat protein
MDRTPVGPPEAMQPGPCPDPKTWVRFAAGLCPGHEQDSLLEHAAGCPACAARLKDLSGAVAFEEPSATDEVAAIDAIEGRLDRKLKGLSHEMSRPGRSAMSRRPWMLAIAACLVAASGFSAWFIWGQVRPHPPFQLLADAYTSRRTLELRIPGAAYAPLRIARGSDGLSDAPPALLESQLEIHRHLAAHPEDSAWLHAQGRAQLLDWQYDAALRSFEAAADLGANSPDFLTDYGSAYYERAERNGNPLDYARALEKLGQALRQRPNDPAALFNRGVVHAKLRQYDAAIQDFESSLRDQRDANWEQETETRIEEVRRLRGNLFNPLPPPSPAFRAESDLETAMVSELVEFFEGRSSKVKQTASEMLAEHRDPWCQEVVLLRPAPDTVRAVKALSELAKLRVKVNPNYEAFASEIQWLRGAALIAPLKVWRDYELLYRDTRSSAVASCAPETASLIEEGRPYPWMQAQILLESSLCSAASQDFHAANALVDRAEKLGRENKLEATSIRIPIFRGQRLAETGYFREAAQQADEALQRMDTGGYPLRRAYDAHGIIMLVAGQLNLSETGYGAAREMAEIGKQDGIGLFEMIGLCRAAGFALALGRDVDATSALQSAQSALSRVGENPTAKIYWRTSRLAWLESRGDRASLYRMLDEAHREGTGKENLYFNRKLISALCRLETRAGNRYQVEQMASPFWEEGAAVANAPGASAAKAFRPELESVSQSVTQARLEAGEEAGALQAWRRFLELDRRLLGERDVPAEASARTDSEAVLTVANLGDRVALWLQIGRQTQFHWAAASTAELTRAVRKIRRLCSLGVPVAELYPAARDLYRVLFPEGVGSARRVSIRTRGLLNTAPLEIFQLLHEGRDVDFSYGPFGEPSSEMIVDRAHARMTMISATSFDATSGMPPVPEDEIDGEAQWARTAFPDTIVIRGKEATAKTVEEAARTSDALHFTGHAVAWRGAIGLLVSPDDGDPSPEGRAGFWSMSRPRSVSAGLVVLSACSTGAFEDVATVEPGQLALSLLLAGSRQVIASLWNVDSAATAAWNGAFYHALATGDPPARAMKLASEQVRSTPGWQSPQYWAGFALYQN